MTDNANDSPRETQPAGKPAATGLAAARRRWLLDTYAMRFRSRARGGREQP